MTTTIEHLRAGTRVRHDAVEALPFFTELAAGRLSLDGYVSFLRSSRALFGAVENAAAASPHAAVAALFNADDAAGASLDADLAALDTVPHRTLSDAELRAASAAHELSLAARADPLRLLGYLYILVGSQLGGMVLRGQVAGALGLSGPAGLEFVGRGGAHAASRWRTFCARLDALPLTAAETGVVVAAADELFADFAGAVAALPAGAQAGRSGVASHLNSDAGTHPVTCDPRELAAALRAGERTWAEHPYYEQRYGERGRRFTRSDSAWLVTLTRSPAAVVDGEVAWLARVLAARGMPRLLLERHLLTLHAELVGAFAGEAGRYAGIGSAARHLGDARRAALSDERLAELGRDFDDLVGASLAGALPRVGELIGGAVADERCGMSGAVPSLVGWLTDGARFPARWVAAVHATVDAARSRA
jgi:heme oxygenase